MIRTMNQALLLLALFVPRGFALHAATTPEIQERVESTGELFDLEEERRRELNELATRLQRELLDVSQGSTEAGDKTAELLERYYEKLTELEREFAEKRGELLHGGVRGREAEGRESRRSEVFRELGKLETERHRELARVDEEFERELRSAREEARGRKSRRSTARRPEPSGQSTSRRSAVSRRGSPKNAPTFSARASDPARAAFRNPT